MIKRVLVSRFIILLVFGTFIYTSVLTLSMIFPISIGDSAIALAQAYCPPADTFYDYSIVVPTLEQFNEVKIIVEMLNDDVGFELFHYNPKSPNKISIVPEKHFKGAVIGETYCGVKTAFCCGTDSFRVNLSDAEEYSMLKGRLILTHELGHVVGLNHKSGKPDIMNPYINNVYESYNNQIEQQFIADLRNRMGLK